MRTRWKLAILTVPVVLLGGAVLRCGRDMEPFKEGSSGDFWHAACHVQVDPTTNHKSIRPTYPPRDGYFVYTADGGGMWIHGAPECFISEDKALADFPAVVRALAAGEHLDQERPLLSEVVDAGYRAWLIRNPERDDAYSLLACIRVAWFDHWRRHDLSLPNFDPLRPNLNLSQYHYHLDSETDFDERWERAKHWPTNLLGEFVYLSFLLVLTAWPWIRNGRPWKWGLHLGLLPVVLFLPYWLGYAPLTFTSADHTGGALYPELIRPFRGLPWTGFDTWALGKIPRILSAHTQYPGPMLAITGMGGVGLVVVVGAGAVFGASVFAAGMIRARLSDVPRLLDKLARGEIRKGRTGATGRRRDN
jgi:hypothetical protein